MKTSSLLCAVAVAAAFAGPANAIYKCTTAKGVVYQDRPCRDGNESDVQIVIPTGEVLPRSLATVDEAAPANGPRYDNQPNAPKAGPTSGDNPVSVTKPVERKSGDAAANLADNSRKKGARSSTESAGMPLAAEQAGKTEPSAKYYSTEAFGSGLETPAQMNCESPTGEKRVFFLSNGKLTSI